MSGFENAYHTSDLPQATAPPAATLIHLRLTPDQFQAPARRGGYSAATTLLPTRFPALREVISVFRGIRRGLTAGWMRHAEVGVASLPPRRVTQAKLLELPPVQQPSRAIRTCCWLP